LAQQNFKKLKQVQSQQKLSPKGLSYLFHANLTDLSQVSSAKG